MQEPDSEEKTLNPNPESESRSMMYKTSFAAATTREARAWPCAPGSWRTASHVGAGHARHRRVQLAERVAWIT